MINLRCKVVKTYAMVFRYFISKFEIRQIDESRKPSVNIVLLYVQQIFNKNTGSPFCFMNSMSLYFLTISAINDTSNRAGSL